MKLPSTLAHKYINAAVIGGSFGLLALFVFAVFCALAVPGEIGFKAFLTGIVIAASKSSHAPLFWQAVQLSFLRTIVAYSYYFIVTPALFLSFAIFTWDLCRKNTSGSVRKNLSQ